MPSVQDDLRSAGISLATDDDPPALRAECARLARLVRASSAITLGMAPAEDDVAVPGVAMKLARAIARESHCPVGVVDALGTWGLGTTPTVDAAENGAAVTTWLLDELALLTLRVSHPSLALPRLSACVAREGALYGSLVVDLTGFERLGERRAAFELLDAAVVVARSGRTTTRQVRDALHDVPDGRGLGVMLTGA